MMTLYDRDTYMRLHDAEKEKDGGLKMLAKLVQKKKMTLQEAAEEAEMSVHEFAQKAGVMVPAC